MYLTQGTASTELSKYLKRPLLRKDALELVVATDVDEDMIHRATLSEVILNKKRLFWPKTNNNTQQCELGRQCLNCYWGIDPSPLTTPPGSSRAGVHGRSRVDTLIFDLDDTLVRTFHDIIVAAECNSAKTMIELGVSGISYEELSKLLHELHLTHPDRLEMELLKRCSGVTTAMLEARRKVFDEDKIDLATLRIPDKVKTLLGNLRKKYSLYLLTSGTPHYQRRKLKHLGLESGIFQDVAIVDKTSGEDKLRGLVTLLEKNSKSPTTCAVIGNRLDEEIQAAKSLGATTVWVKDGEGSLMFSEALSKNMADFVISDITELNELFLQDLK